MKSVSSHLTRDEAIATITGNENNDEARTIPSTYCAFMSKFVHVEIGVRPS
jgi:hypothetical protein